MVKTECSVCPTPIWHKQGNKLKKTSEFNLITVKLNNSSKMEVGVCSKHTHPTEDQLQVMTDRIHEGWQEEVIAGVGSESWVKETGDKLSVVGVA